MITLSRLVRFVVSAVVLALAALLSVALWGAGNLVMHVTAMRSDPPVRALPETSFPSYDPSRKVAVVVTGIGGAEMTDFLTPFDVLGTTGAFNMYVVAPERRVIPLANAAVPDGGVDLVPHFSLAEYDREIGRAPDVIVIPFLPAFASGGERELVPWIRRHADRGALIVSICAGTEVLAATGLLDGGPATTHPNFFARLGAEYRNIEWVRDVRYVERERTISSGAIASGMDASLVAVRRLLGRAEAERVARELGYTHVRFLDDPRYATKLDVWTSATAATWPGRRTDGVMLYAGVGELELGSIFDTYALTFNRSLVSVAATAGVIETRHGMRLLPRHVLGAPAFFGRMLVPGREVPAAVAAVLASWRGEVARIHEGSSSFPYDATLRDIARRDSRLEAASIATNLNYPIDHLDLGGMPVPVSLVVMPVVLALLGIVAALRVRRAWRAYRIRKWSASSTAGRGSNASERSMTLRSSRTLPGHA